MVPKWQSKPGLSAEEVVVLKIRLSNEGWERTLPSPSTVASERVLALVEADPPKGECAWGRDGLCITSIYRGGVPKPRVLRRFMRAYWCAASMAGLAKEIPSFPYLPYDLAVEECLSDGVMAPDEEWPYGRTLYVPLHCVHPPASLGARHLTFADMLTSPDVPTWKVISCFAQVVLALGLATRTLRFAHNALQASSVLLAPHAKIFSLNFAEISLLCADHIAVITGYSHAQYAYALSGRVVEVPPDPEEGTAANLEANSLSDVYAFARSCFAISKGACTRTLSTSDNINRRHTERTIFFRKVLEQFVSPLPADPLAWPSGVLLRRGMGIAGSLRGILENMGLRLMRSTSPNRGNAHLRPNSARESTWYAMDLRSLAAYDPPPATLPMGAGPEFDEGTHLRFLCSQLADAAINKVLADPSVADPRDLAEALEEVPLTLLLEPRMRARVLGSAGARELYSRRAEEIMDTIILRGPAGERLTIGGVLKAKPG